MTATTQPPVGRDVPPCDVDAEKAALAAVLTEPAFVQVLFDGCNPEHFYLEAHKWIARAVQGSTPCNLTTVMTWLKDCGRLAIVGGSAYVAQLLDTVPASLETDIASYAAIIRYKWELRAAKARAIELAALCQTGAVEDIAAAFQTAATSIEQVTTRQRMVVLTGKDVFAVASHIDTLIPGLGLKPGPVTMFAARGGIGKSVALQSLALSAIMGRPVWGLFPVVRPLRVLWIDLEQGEQTTLLRFKRLALAMELTPEDLQGYLGVLISPDVSDEAKLVRLMRGYDICVIDCYRVLASGVDENSSFAREPLDACARASEKANCACMIIHHGRKATEGGRGGTRDVTRGSSAIQDACDAVFYLDRDTEESSGPISCVCAKVPRATGRAPDGWTLTIEDCDLYYSADYIEGDAGLRVTGSHPQPVDTFALEAERARATTERLRAELLAEFARQSIQPGADALAARLGRKAVNVRTALASLIDDGSIRAEGNGRSFRHVLIRLPETTPNLSYSANRTEE